MITAIPPTDLFRVNSFIRLPKQRLVHDPHVGGRRGLAIGKVLEQKISRLAGEFAPVGLDLERVVNLCGHDSLSVGVRLILSPAVSGHFVGGGVAFVEILLRLRPDGGPSSR